MNKVLADEIVNIVAGKNYQSSVYSLRMLAIAIVFSIIGYFWGDGILIAHNKEKILLIGTCISAIVNVLLNFILMPIWQQNAAAFTTVIAELVSAIFFTYYGSKSIKLHGIIEVWVKPIVGCLAIVAWYYIVRMIELPFVIRVIIIVVGSVLIYAVIEIAIKNKAVLSIKNDIVNKIRQSVNPGSINEG